MQRVVRYPLLLRTILKLLDSSSEEYNCLLGKEAYVSPQQPIRWGLLIWLDADKDFNRFFTFSEAVTAIEKVAEHINEMQRITEQFSPVFHQLIEEFGVFEVNYKSRVP